MNMFEHQESYRVLVVDDEPHVITSVADLLEEEFEVLTFTNPEKALNFMSSGNDISVILTDQRMPGISGDEFLSEAKELSGATRVLMTGYSDLDSVIRAINRGQIYAYLAKPWDPMELKVLILKAAEHYRLMQKLSHERDLLHSLMDNIPDTIYFKDANLRFTRINKAHARQLNLPSPGDVVGKTVFDFSPADLAKQIDSEERRIMKSGEPLVNKIEKISSADKNYWVSTTKVPLKDGKGKARGLVGISRDITEYKQLLVDLEQTKQLERHFASHDTLTKLANRQFFSDRLQQALDLARRYGYKVAVLLLNINRFKRINESYGHSVGDGLLKSVAQRLKDCIRKGDCVSRFGGDEFTIMLEEIAHVQDVSKVADEILRRLSEPFVLDGTSLTITSSIGIGLYPNDASDIESLIKAADKAMRRARDEGHNAYQFYNSFLDAEALERMELENNLHNAIQNSELVLHYQPQIAVDSRNIIGVEALIRWQHPELGLLPPSKFISLAEETGDIVPIGEWVLTRACEQIKAWRESGPPAIRMAVNLSARQFRVMNLEESINKILTKTKVNPDAIVLELTETNVMQNVDYSIMTLKSLREMGVRIAIDDFGTGYASLNYLKRLPLDILKVDRTFVDQLHSHHSDWAILSAIVAMAHELQLKVLVEGVEYEEQMTYLRTLKCDELQGYYFCKPLPPEQITPLFSAAN